jgi:hypothetical protein
VGGFGGFSAAPAAIPGDLRVLQRIRRFADSAGFPAGVLALASDGKRD